MIIYYSKVFAIEWHRNLKYWGDSIQYDCCVDSPYIRLWALFIWYKGMPALMD